MSDEPNEQDWKDAEEYAIAFADLCEKEPGRLHRIDTMTPVLATAFGDRRAELPAAGDVEAAEALANEIDNNILKTVTPGDRYDMIRDKAAAALRAARADEREKYKAEYSENDREAAVAIAREILIRNFDEETDEDWIEQFANDFADVFLGIIRSNRLACDMYQKERARVAELEAAGRELLESDGFTRRDGTRATYDAHKYCEAHDASRRC